MEKPSDDARRRVRRTTHAIGAAKVLLRRARSNSAGREASSPNGLPCRPAKFKRIAPRRRARRRSRRAGEPRPLWRDTAQESDAPPLPPRRRPEPRPRAGSGGKPARPSARPLGTDAGSPTLSRKAAPAPAPAPAAADTAEESRRRRRTRRCPVRLERARVAAAPAEMRPKLAPREPARNRHRYSRPLAHDDPITSCDHVVVGHYESSGCDRARDGGCSPSRKRLRTTWLKLATATPIGIVTHTATAISCRNLRSYPIPSCDVSRVSSLRTLGRRRCA